MEDSRNSSALMISLLPITSPTKRAEEVFYDPIYHGSAGISFCTSSSTCSPHPSQPYIFSCKSSCRQRPPFYADDFSIYEYVHVRNPRLLMDAGPIDSCSAPLGSIGLPSGSAPNSTGSAYSWPDSTGSLADSAPNPPLSASNLSVSLPLGLKSSSCLANSTVWDQSLTPNPTSSPKSNGLYSDSTGSANSACDSG